MLGLACVYAYDYKAMGSECCWNRNLKHIVVLMMENRSFDHVLGSLRAQDQRIDGLTGNESNPDTTGAKIKVSPQAEFQSQLDPDPGHHYPGRRHSAVLRQRGSHHADHAGVHSGVFQQRKDVNHSHKIMNYFTPDKLPVLTTLAQKYAVFNRWFSSLPGPTIPNRAFAHFGTSFGHTDMNVFYRAREVLSVYERMRNAGRTAKIYYYDQQSSTIGVGFPAADATAIVRHLRPVSGGCKAGTLPDYSFIEPNYTDHDADDGEALASDQHPDHDVQAGEAFIATVYNAVRSSPLWENTALLIVYDEHGGIYDHVPPPACTPDEFPDQRQASNSTAWACAFPPILVSPWVAEGTVVSPLNGNGTVDDLRVFEHASIPNTVTSFFIGDYDARTQREKESETFLDILSLPTPRTDYFVFNIGGGAAPAQAHAFAAHAMARRPLRLPTRSRSLFRSLRRRHGSGPAAFGFDSKITIDHLHKAELTLPPDQQTGDRRAIHHNRRPGERTTSSK